MPPYSEDLADRVRARLSHLDGLSERSVMSGIGFFVEERMAVAVLVEGLCLRLTQSTESPDEATLTDTAVMPLEFAGRMIEGWVCIPEPGLDEASLSLWVSRGVAGLDLSM